MRIRTVTGGVMHKQAVLRLLAVATLLFAGCRDERTASTGTFTQRLGSISVSSFSPQSGTVGTQVTVQGANLDGAANVSFGSVNAPFTVDSPTQLRAYVPPGATSGQLNLSDLNGQNNAQSSGSFT